MSDEAFDIDAVLDPLPILAAFIHKANVEILSDFLSLSQLDVEEPEIYEQAMSRSHVQQWAHTIQKELNQLKKNLTWELVFKTKHRTRSQTAL